MGLSTLGLFTTGWIKSLPTLFNVELIRSVCDGDPDHVYKIGIDKSSTDKLCDNLFSRGLARIREKKLHSNMVRAYKVFQDFFSGSGEVAYQNEVTFMANEEAYLKPQLQVLTPRLQVVESRRENTVKN